LAGIPAIVRAVSAPFWVGLLSVVGLAMQTGVVMVVYIDEAFHRRVREGKLASRDDIVEATPMAPCAGCAPS
jgi:Cu/Ag efflux pump CusA